MELLTNTSPEFEGAALLSREGKHSEYEFDMGQTSMSAVLSQIGAVEGVANVEIKKAPIEDVIAGLYMEWKK